ncbi:VOC family protein [Caulobacter sp. RL271]|uniref:VOC family protein n=1 Tax=Caulobacter segnis TaxID=88688 RepID=A0ABY4ZYJ1_9CAUL|nr:VOC family protein [Caulobacter segnis]USQ97877.1 VOC family protein [Caulobacter segnis]
MSDSRPGLVSALSYRDPKAAIAFLEKAFGFDLSLLIEDAEGNLAHSQMEYAGHRVMIGNEWSENHASPASVGLKNTQSVHIYIAADVDAHCARAQAAGAEIIAPPEAQFYGARTYRCRDPEGHIWTVSADVEVVSTDEMEKRSGLTIAVGKG